MELVTVSKAPRAGVAQRRRALAPAIAGALLVASLAAGSAAAGEPVRIDRSAGSYAGLVWLVRSPADAPAGELFVGVGIGRLADAPLEQSFALWREGDETRLGSPAAMPAELAAEGREVIEVAVEHRAHDEVRYLIARWAQGEQEGTEPAVRLENLLDRVARALGMKTPYRSVLRGSDPAAYLRDLARLNAADR